jgi:hypothetical protein
MDLGCVAGGAGVGIYVVKKPGLSTGLFAFGRQQSWQPKALQVLFDPPTHRTLLKMPPMTHYVTNEQE